MKTKIVLLLFVAAIGMILLDGCGRAESITDNEDLQYTDDGMAEDIISEEEPIYYDTIAGDLDINDWIQRIKSDLDSYTAKVTTATEYVGTDYDLSYESYHKGTEYLLDIANVLHQYPSFYGVALIDDVDEFYRIIQAADTSYKNFVDGARKGVSDTEIEALWTNVNNALNDIQGKLNEMSSNSNKISDRVKSGLYAEQEQKKPAIGMTAAEIEQSTWGKPDKVNKTTYAWGTTEQWCYSNSKYIYFENGVVTAISE